MGVKIEFIVNKQLGLGPVQTKKVQADTKQLAILLGKIKTDPQWGKLLTTGTGMLSGKGDFLLLEDLDLNTKASKECLRDAGELQVICQALLDSKDTALRMRLTKAQKQMLREQTEGHLMLLGIEMGRRPVSPKGQPSRFVDCLMFQPEYRTSRIFVIYSDL